MTLPICFATFLSIIFLTVFMLLKLIISIDMDLIQSFVFTVGRCGLGRYEQRILMKIVEYAQQSLAGKLIKNNLTQWQHDYDNVLLSFPVRDLMLDNDKHYERVFDAAERLMSKKFSFQSASGDWFATPIIYNVYHAAGSGVLSFYVARRLFDVILDFSKGFRQFSLSQALQIPSPYACRLFALMSGQSVPLTLSIDELKKMFGVEEKYAQVEKEIKRLTHTGASPSPALSAFLAEKGTADVTDGCPMIALLRRPQLHYEELAPFDPTRPVLPPDVTEQVEISVKYEGYIQRQQKQVEDFRKMESHRLPPDLDYSSSQGLRLEAREKLSAIRPLDLGQASRVSGVSPADITALMIWLER